MRLTVQRFGPSVPAVRKFWALRSARRIPVGEMLDRTAALNTSRVISRSAVQHTTKKIPATPERRSQWAGRPCIL